MDGVAYDLADLSTIALDEAWLKDALADDALRADQPQDNLHAICNDFVQAFLGRHADAVSTLYGTLHESVATLQEIEAVLESFVRQLAKIHNDIGEVRHSLLQIGTSLNNTRVAEKVLWGAVAQLVVPPEVVQVLTQSNAEQLGPQFKLSVVELLKFLHCRRGTSATDFSSSPTDGGPADSSTREVRVSLQDCKVFTDGMGTLDHLTMFACIKMKAFLSKKIMVLTIKDTNVCIQQENTLREYAIYVQFLRQAPALLRHRAAARPRDMTSIKAMLPYRIARALYHEFRQEYVAILAAVYLKRIQDYVFVCNALELRTTTSAPTRNANVLPQLSDTSSGSSTAWHLGERGAILGRLFDPPLIPAMQRARHERHSYEETFRSVLVLLCDVVSHEYLFTFEFFAGDMSVYVGVFKDTVQFVVDYLAEVILTQSSGSVRQLLHERPHTSVNTNAQYDTYGLLLLIRMCHEFRLFMRQDRKLSCLDGLFDSLLVQLWPAFNKNLDLQLVSLRCVRYPDQMTCMGHLPPAQQLSFVHPLVKSFAEFAGSIMSIALGTSLEAPQLTTRDASGERISSMEDVAHAQGGDGVLSMTEITRLQALKMIEAEKEVDAADSSSRFAVVLGSISRISVEVIHSLEEIEKLLIAKLPQTAPWKGSFVLNNLHHALQVLSSCPVLGDGEAAASVRDRGNLSVLIEAHDKCHTQLLEDVLRFFMRDVYAAAHAEGNTSPDQMKRSAEDFHANWRTYLDSIHEFLHKAIGDAAHERELIAQVCMNCLLLNTRFHTAVGKVLDIRSKEHRSLLVPNQQLLQHMRHFSSTDSTS